MIEKKTYFFIWIIYYFNLNENKNGVEKNMWLTCVFPELGDVNSANIANIVSSVYLHS